MAVLADTVDIVIGVDPHKHTHTAAIIAARTGKKLATRTVKAEPTGFSELVDVADAYPGSRCWVIEGCGSCGSWGRGLAAWLMAAGETVREIDAPRRPARRMGKKDDDIDAIRAAREALGREDLPEPRCTGDRDALAALLIARRSAVQMASDMNDSFTRLLQLAQSRSPNAFEGSRRTGWLRHAPAGDQRETLLFSQRPKPCVPWLIGSVIFAAKPILTKP